MVYGGNLSLGLNYLGFLGDANLALKTNRLLTDRDQPAWLVEADRAGLRLANGDIDRRCRGADAQAHALATGALERELAQLSATAALQPRILALLADASGPWPTAHAVARRLHISPRTLHRRLEAESTSFRTLVDACRRARATEMLRHSALPIERIGEILGYADPSNFGRSCRRWFGCSPRQHRRGPGGGP